jgi:transcriptional regulator with XRE-family HTH domain
VATTTNSNAAMLARRLRELREANWPDRKLTQVQLAKALSSEGYVAPATVSSWESGTNPKKPPMTKISTYARFFCTRRSLAPAPHLIPEDELAPDELERLSKIESELLELLQPGDRLAQRTLQFDTGPVVVICPTAPPELRGPLGDPENPNFTKLRLYGDLDALVELYGHLRAENPSLEVFHRITDDVVADDFSSHLILLGGIGWNKVTQRFQHAISQVPVTQTEVEELQTGEIFRVDAIAGTEAKAFYPEYEDVEDRKGLIGDVGFIARLRHPFQEGRTLTIYNGIHSHGVLGAVRCMTDVSVRDNNEAYLASQFPNGEFAILLRVPVVNNQTLSPDLRKPATLLYEWTPHQDDRR